MKKQFWFTLLGLCLVVMYAFGEPAGGRGKFIPEAQSTEAPALLQFTSGGQVLGFTKEAVYVASGSYAYRVEFINVNPTAPVADSTQSDTARAAPLSRVAYSDLWPGITLTYDAPEGAILRSGYRLEPHADPDAIRLRYNVPAQIGNDGTLALAYETGVMRESAPIAWQEIGSTRIPVQVAFTIRHPQSVVNEAEPSSIGNQEVGFAVGAYDPAYPLFIDPMLTWNTFLGGSGWVVGDAIAVDGSGNAYVAGTSDISWQGTNPPVSSHSGGYDAFAAKLDSSGGLTWNTFLGGNGIDYGLAIAVDGTGNVYVAGESTATWGTGECAGCPIRAYTGGFDAFAAKLSSSGGLIWNTFLGGSGWDTGSATAVDGSGHVYVAGRSGTTWQGANPPVRAYTAGYDAFAAQLNSISGALTWNTFLGSSEYDEVYAITMNGGGNLVVAGTSDATWQGTNPPIRPHAGGYEAFAANVNSNSGALIWNTFLGGTGNDWGNSIAVDSSGNVYVAGSSDATWGSPVRGYTGSRDAFAAKLNSSGALTLNTFLGGSGDDWGGAIAVDGSGNTYVAGRSDVTWGSPLRAYTGGGDAFAAKLNSSGGLTWNTFLGGSEDDGVYAIKMGVGGNVVVVGTSDATWQGVNPPILLHSGGLEAFAAQLNSSSGALTWNTFLGESAADVAYAIAVDGSGNVYVAGYSEAHWGGPVRAHMGGMDAFAAKLNSSGGLTWNTFLGGSGDDYGYGIAVDGSGNVYVVGTSYATWGSPVRTFKSNVDAFVAQLNSSGGLTWNTFLGGSGFDTGWAIAVDGSGNVYVAGDSDVSWQGTNPPVRIYKGSGDAFAAQLNSSSGALTWNTFLGGFGGDAGRAIDVDGSGVYVAGTSNATWGLLECIDCPIRPYKANGDAFAAQLNSSSGALIWNTFLGGDGVDWGSAIVLEGDDKLYVAGISHDTWGSPVRDYTGGSDAFVARLTNGALTWNTFLGEGGDDYGSAIATDGYGNVYVAGTSHATWGSPVRAYNDGRDAFSANVNSNSGALIWNTFLGGNGDDDGYAIAVGMPGNVYVAGRSDSTWGLPIRAYTADWDAFVSKLSYSIFLPLIKK